MQQAPTAATIIRALERSRLQAGMAALAALDSTHSDAVRAALAAVPRKSRIDVRLLLDSVRREVSERAARRPPAEAWKYAVTLMSDGQVEQFKRLVSSGFDPAAAARQVMDNGRPLPAMSLAQAGGDAEPDDELDDESEVDLSRRRSIPRRRSRREEQAPKPQPRPEPSFGPKLFGAGAGDRPLGCPEAADYATWKNPALPPWVMGLDDGGAHEGDQA